MVVISIKLVKLDSNLCTFCENVWETIYHLLWDCPNVQQLLGTQRQLLEYTLILCLVIMKVQCNSLKSKVFNILINMIKNTYKEVDVRKSIDSKL